jgi:hypothetical protein
VGEAHAGSQRSMCTVWPPVATTVVIANPPRQLSSPALLTDPLRTTLLPLEGCVAQHGVSPIPSPTRRDVMRRSPARRALVQPFLDTEQE